MRKFSLPLTLGACLLLVAGAGCLKDKGYDDQDYGLQVNERKGVAFPQAAASPIAVGINSQTAPLTIEGPGLALEQNSIASSNVTITVVMNNTLVTDAGKTVMPAGSFSIPSLTVTIPAGSKFSDALKITFPNTSLLDPTKEYGLGFTISAVDQGYTIAANQKNVLFTFTIKNKYDGNYSMTITTKNWAAFGISENMPGTWPSISGGYSIGMVTGGANSVRLYDYWGFDDYIQPAFTTNNAQGTGFGATAPRFIFDLSTDRLINVVNDLPDDGRGRVFLLNPAAPPTTNYYDPATKKIFASYLLKNNGRPDLEIVATFTYLSPRP